MIVANLGLHAEKLLVLALLAFYLKDCLVLLRQDEAVLVRGLFGRWRAGFGSRHYQLSGRHPYLCNPFLPFEPVLRLRWADSPAMTPCWPGRLPEQLRPLQPAVLLIALLLFVALPAALIGQRGVFVLLVVVAMLYLVILASVAWVAMQRESLGLDGKACAILAAEVLLCPPYAANLVRKLSLRQKIDADLVASIDVLLSSPQRQAVLAHCHAVLGDRLETVDEDSPAAIALSAARSRFAQGVGHQHD